MDNRTQTTSLLPPSDSLAEARGIPDLVIAEVAGRDSVAAMVAYAADHPHTTFLPTVVATGTEYGDFSAPDRAVEIARSLLRESRVLGVVRLADPTLWAALNGRLGAVLAARYPGWSPCAACHLYVHLARAPLSFALGSAPIVTGERDTHDGRYKLSQTPDSIDASISVLGEFGIELIEPIRHLAAGSDIERLVGPGWDEGAQQLSCVHSGSFKDAEGRFEYDAEHWLPYLEEFYVPAARAILRVMASGEHTADWHAVVRDATRR